MTREAEAEAWVRKSRRVFHSQFLIQTFAVLAIVAPLPIVAVTFWAVFGLASPLVIRSILFLWIAATMTFAVLSLHAKIRQKEL